MGIIYNANITYKNINSRISTVSSRQRRKRKAKKVLTFQNQKFLINLGLKLRHQKKKQKIK